MWFARNEEEKKEKEHESRFEEISFFEQKSKNLQTNNLLYTIRYA